jgi:peptidoglycan hydrolase-like protein with peptidoglycan-binding domain
MAHGFNGPERKQVGYRLDCRMDANGRRSLARSVALAVACLALSSDSAVTAAQSARALQAGDSYVTRFSGTSTSSSGTVIDLDGTVGSVIDLRNPSQPPQGQHWLNEPQRHPITARETGQIFGVALDAAASPNVYLTATSAFGLHRTADNSGWMPGMWGPDGGPGTVWKVGPETGYKPAIFATVGVGGRANTSAALGNIAYDKWNNQLYVSDLESGLIHRLRPKDGADLGQFDHGVKGRARFLDRVTDQQRSLSEVAFDPTTAARISDCAGGDFAKKPECWNYADFRRRVWGLGVRKDNASGEVRLYYAIWSSQALGSADFAAAQDEEKRNSVWSVAITSDGAFDEKSVRKEFLLPDFFTNPADIARAGRSHPVADIAFCKCTDEKVMLVAERGGVRNLGLDAESPFAYPHEARVLAYELDDGGTWQLKGRYDAGHYDRKNEGQPFVRANASGGVDFGYGYGVEWHIDQSRPDKMAWLTGGTLCSPHGPCFSPGIGRAEDGSYVAGAQGTPLGAYSDLLPAAAKKPYPAAGVPYPATGPLQTYLFDADKNLDAKQSVIMSELTRNDATKIGDIEIYELCEKEKAETDPPLVDETPELVDPPVVVDTPPDSDIPDLEKVKDGPAQCIEGGICTFTITITNRGPGVWSGPLREIDTLPPGSLLWDYRPQPAWLCTQVAGTDTVNCAHDWVTLNPGDSVSLEVDVLLPFGVTGPVDNCIQDVWLPGRDPNDPAVILVIEQTLNALGYAVGPIDGVLDIVTINSIMLLQANNGLPATGVPDQALIDLLFGGSAGFAGDANPANDMDCHTVDVVPLPPPAVAPPAAPVPDLQTRKVQRTPQCRAGGLCDFEVWFINRGPGDWTGVPEIVDTLPQGATFVAATAPAICTQTGRTLTCRYPRQITLAPNTRGRVIITVRMPPNLRPGVQNCVTIPAIANAGDPNPANNRQCIPVRVAPPPVPDMQILKIQSGGDCTPGKDCTFDIWFINRGPVTWTGTPQFSDDLPANVRLLSASNPWKCQQNGKTVTCAHDRITIPPMRGIKASITVRLPATLAPGARNCVHIEGDGNARRDPIPQNNQQCVTIRTLAPPQPGGTPPQKPVEPKEPHTPPPAEPSDTRAEKSQLGPCKPGKSCLFELKFKNKGPGAWSGKAKLTDLLPSKAARLGTWSPSTWSCKQSDAAISCEHAGATVAPNEHLSVTMTVKLPEHLPSEALNCVVLERPEIGAIDPSLVGDRKCIKIDVATPGFAPRPPAVVQPKTPCPEGTVRKNGQCVTVARSCPKGYVLKGGRCYGTKLTCPKGYRLRGKKCYSTRRTCPKGYVLRGKKCYSTRRTCPRGYVLRGKRCYPRVQRICPPGYLKVGNVCVRIPPIRRRPRGGHGHGYE